MNFAVRGKNTQVTDALRNYVEKRLGKLDKHFEGEGEATVTLKVEKERHAVEVTIIVGGMILRAEEASGDMYASIDMVVEKLEKQIEKYKTKLARQTRQNSFRVIGGNGNAPDEEEFTPKVVKTKRFAIKPMTVDEAVLQMNLLGHDFFVFSNAETEEVNVVYRRRDGNFGLIEPEF